MPQVPEKPPAEHPKDVRRWVLECVAAFWTESGTDWQVDAKRNLLVRNEGDFTFELVLRPSQRVKRPRSLPHEEIVALGLTVP
jgi:hypothetical protein